MNHILTDDSGRVVSNTDEKNLAIHFCAIFLQYFYSLRTKTQVYNQYEVARKSERMSVSLSVPAIEWSQLYRAETMST